MAQHGTEWLWRYDVTKAPLYFLRLSLSLLAAEGGALRSYISFSVREGGRERERERERGIGTDRDIRTVPTIALPAFLAVIQVEFFLHFEIYFKNYI